MTEKTDILRYQSDGIIAEMANYFEIRYEQLTRISAGLASMHADLLWMQMEKVRDVMTHEKMFGPVRLRVVEILASRDESKRRAVMGPIDQASIMNELVPEEETAARRPGFLAVRNMRQLFTSVNASLGPVIELTDIWLWWDILDAADVFNFKEQKKFIERRKSEPVTAQMQSYYHDALRIREERETSREEILSYEFAYLELLWKYFMQRRKEEESFMRVIKIDPIGGDDSVDDLIVMLTSHIKARRRLAEEGGLDDRLREYYAKALKVDPPKVTAERAISHEDVQILQLRQDLRAGLERGAVLGKPYDYKRVQGKEMTRDAERYRKELPLVEAVVAAVAQAVAVPAAPKPAESQAPLRSQPRPAEIPLGEQETLADEGPLLY